MKKNSRTIILILLIVGVVFIANNSCKKDEVAGPVPVLTTATVTNIGYSTAFCGGTITSDVGLAIKVRGVCWSIAQTPTVANNKTLDGAGGGSFTSSITGLNANTTYFVRAYATNDNGTGYGIAYSFKTIQSLIPILATDSVKSITQTTAICGGSISVDYGSNITERGVCWNTSITPTIADSKTTDDTGIGHFTSNISGLTANTTYYLRAYATNSSGTGYGNTFTFTTQQDFTTLPVLYTASINNITNTSAISGGTITSVGGTLVIERGVCWSTSPAPTVTDSKTNDGSGGGSFISNITGLNSYTNYYVRAYATNYAGTAYGNVESFTTHNPTIPVLTTEAVNSITLTTGNSGGTIISDGASPITAKGICYSTSPNPTITDNKTNDGLGSSNFTSTLSGLTLNTTYYVKAYATNSVGTAYGNEIIFTTRNGIITLNTSSPTTIKATSATTGGNITNDGGATVTARGICYSTSPTPTKADNKTIDGSGLGNFTSYLSSLPITTKYYVRAYATNIVGTYYGNEVSFTTQNGIINITTLSALAITSTTATSGGNISNDGGAPVTARGVCYSINLNPTIADNTTNDGTGSGTFSSNLTGLTLYSTYYLRAYATNGFGTTYGNQISFMAISIGDSYQGGVIAYILQSGDPGYDITLQHGLIAAPSDQNTSIIWYNLSNTITGATGTDLGTGNANTNAIISNQGAGNYAAKICYDLILGGYSDWYLPSKDELNKLYLNKIVIGGFSTSYYWSSTEGNSDRAWSQNFNTGSQTNYNKTGILYVRAVRSF